MLARASSTVQYKGESQEEYLSRITHTKLNNKGIERMENLQLADNLRVLYLYDNAVSSLEGLRSNRKLEQLHLQNNRISSIPADELTACGGLEKLLLDNNAIARVENLEKLQRLRELHISEQALTDAQQFSFAPETLEALSLSLRVLHIAGNGLRSLMEVVCL